MEIRRFIIPDIHGCAVTVRHLLEKELRVTKTDQVYLLGDMIDRGPRSKEVLDLLLELTESGFSINCVRGNHEQMLLDALETFNDLRTWVINGGHSTLNSFEINTVTEIPSRYIDFIRSLPYYRELEEFVLVHAGLNVTSNEPFADTWSMLWSREERIDKGKIGNRRVICGHTPHSRETIESSLHENVIVLDNGCVYNNRPRMGHLTALELNTMNLTFQENID